MSVVSNWEWLSEKFCFDTTAVTAFQTPTGLESLTRDSRAGIHKLLLMGASILIMLFCTTDVTGITLPVHLSNDLFA